MAASSMAPHKSPASASQADSQSTFDALTIGIWSFFLVLVAIVLFVMYPSYSINKDLRPGSVLFKQEQYQDALPHFEHLTHRQPKVFDYWLKLGICQLETEQPEAALATFTQAAKVSPKSNLDRELGMTYAALKRYDEAAPYLARVLKTKPLDADANFYQGTVFVAQQRYQEAAQAFAIAAKEKRLLERAAPYRDTIARAVLGDAAATVSETAPTTATATPAP